MINIDLSDARAHENGFNVGLDETQITVDIHNIKICCEAQGKGRAKG